MMWAIYEQKPWNCLRCDKRISDSEFDANNGVCNDCPRLATVPEAIRHKLVGEEAPE